MARTGILVTGASGFVGKNLTSAMAMSQTVRAFVRPTSDVSALRGNANIEFRYGDIETGKGLESALAGIQVVVHSAARTTGRCLNDYYRSNVIGTWNLVKAMERGKVKKLVFLSSQAVCTVNDPAKAVDEDTEAVPFSSYGYTKKVAEDIVAASRLDYIILRPSGVYGPYDVEMYKYIMMIDRGICPIVGSSDKRFSFIHVVDLVRLVIKIISEDLFNREIYFVSDGNCYSMVQSVQDVTRALDRKSPVKIHVPVLVAMLGGLLGDVFLKNRKPFGRDKVRELAQNCWVCSSAKLTRETGFKPQFDFARGMADTVRWYRRNGWL
jgi:nucleoside-diphosphate-sugar epimerase